MTRPREDLSCPHGGDARPHPMLAGRMRGGHQAELEQRCRTNDDPAGSVLNAQRGGNRNNPCLALIVQFLQAGGAEAGRA